MKFNVFQISRQGGRVNNEDRMGYSYTRDAALFVLADGMGGHADGEIASHIALQTMASLFHRQAAPMVKNPADFLSDSLLAAHHQILRYAAEKGLTDSPRTTLVALLIQKGYAIWVHCGDSRLYVVRKGGVLLRTRDHSYVEQGEHFVSHAEPINRNVLFTCLGSNTRPIFDVSSPLLLHPQDRLLLCSDGVWDHLKDEEIAEYIADVNQPLEIALQSLVEEALLRGGPTADNTTAIGVSWGMQPVKNTSAVVTDSILAGVFASTIQTAHDASAGAELLEDEVDIEKSIAEINAAIKRVPVRH